MSVGRAVRVLRTLAYATPTVALMGMLLSDMSRYCAPSGNTCSRFQDVVAEVGTVAFVVVWVTLPFACLLGLHDLEVATSRWWRRARRETR